MTDRARLTLEQVEAFLSLAEQGSIRAAARALYLTEQGARNRLVALEERLGASLYRKGRGRRTRTRLTEEGRRFLPRARDLLARADDLSRTFGTAPAVRTVRVAASAYLAHYLLIGAVRRFHRRHPDIRICLLTRSERQIETQLLENPSISMGLVAPGEPSPDLRYDHLFSMDWSAVAPANHRFSRRPTLADLAGRPLILFEPGSTGRQHILEAFGRRSLAPRIEMEATSTPTIIRMVEAGLGLSILPLLPDGSVTRGRRVAVRPLGRQVREIRSGILTRRDDAPSPAANRFIEFVKRVAAPLDSRFRRS